MVRPVCRSLLVAETEAVTGAILTFPDFTKTFVLDTDASNEGIGAVLSQEDEGRETVVAYASKVLSKAERRYCVTRRELLAVVTFLQHFRLSLRTLLRTTDRPWFPHLATQLQEPRELAGKMASTYARNMILKLSIYYSHKHDNADVLSQVSCKQCGRDSHAESEDVMLPLS